MKHSQSISRLSELISNSYQDKIRTFFSSGTFNFYNFPLFLVTVNLIVRLVAGASAGSVIPPNVTQLQEGAGRTHPRTDQLTRGVPVAFLSKEDLELGDNPIDFILFFAGLGEARRRHFNRAASPPES